MKHPRSAKPSAATMSAWRAALALFEDPLDARYTVVEHDEGGAKRATAAFESAPYATVSLIDGALEVAVRAPDERRRFASVWKFYEEPAEHPGWLCIRRPATRHAAAWIDADLDALVGAVQRDLRRAVEGPRFHAVLTGGAPLLVLPWDLRATWRGAEADPLAIERLARGREPAHTVEIGGATALVLTAPDETTWVPTDPGGMLVQIVSFTGVQDRIAAQVLSVPPRAEWHPVASRFEVTGPLLAFDAARSGATVGDAESLRLDLAPGWYRIDARTFMPDEATEFVLVRFVMAGADPTRP